MMTKHIALIMIQNIETSIVKIEGYVSEDEFGDYCDEAQILIVYWQNILKELNENEPTDSKSK